MKETEIKKLKHSFTTSTRISFWQTFARHHFAADHDNKSAPITAC
jgi:hypothetical protein